MPEKELTDKELDKLFEAGLDDVDYYELDKPDSEYDNLSDRYCDSCPARLTKAEFEMYENQCSECISEETSGIIFDHPERELE